MIRFILVVILLFGFLAASAVPLFIGEKVAWKDHIKKQQEYSLKVVQAMFRMILRVSGVKLTVKGRENIPDEAVLYVGNHRSYFDILVGYVTVPGLTGFVAKKEMLRYPVLRDWMRNVNCLFLDRKDIKAGLRTILDGIEKVKSGVSVWIFPEGTRNGNHDIMEMLPFIRPSHVTIEFGAPFYIKDLEPGERKHSGAYTEERIREMLKREQEARKG